MANINPQEIASTEKLRFLDEVETVNLEADKLKREENVDIVIVLSHAGLNVDKVMAAKCPTIDLIVGGHSHSLLYTGSFKHFLCLLYILFFYLFYSQHSN